MLGMIIAVIALGVKFEKKSTSPPTLAPTEPDYREEEGLDLMQNASAKLSLPAMLDGLVGAGSDHFMNPECIHYLSSDKMHFVIRLKPMPKCI